MLGASQVITIREAEAMQETINTLRKMDMMRLVPVVKELQQLIKDYEWMMDIEAGDDAFEDNIIEEGMSDYQDAWEESHGY